MFRFLIAHGRRHWHAYRHAALIALLFVFGTFLLARFGSRTASGSTRPSKDMTAVALAGAAKDPGTPFNPIAPPRLAGTMHDVDIRVEERPMTIAPGVVQRVWTFNGSVPGPVLRVRVGDTMRVHFRNSRRGHVGESAPQRELQRHDIGDPRSAPRKVRSYDVAGSNGRRRFLWRDRHSRPPRPRTQRPRCRSG